MCCHFFLLYVIYVHFPPFRTVCLYPQRRFCSLVYILVGSIRNRFRKMSKLRACKDPFLKNTKNNEQKSRD